MGLNLSVDLFDFGRKMTPGQDGRQKANGDDIPDHKSYKMLFDHVEKPYAFDGSKMHAHQGRKQISRGYNSGDGYGDKTGDKPVDIGLQ